MILFEVDAVGITLGEFEGDAPRSIDVNAVARGAEAPERVEIKSRNIHVGWPLCCIQRVEAFKDASVESFVDPAPSALPKYCQFLVAEGPDHFRREIMINLWFVKRCLTEGPIARLLPPRHG